MAKQSELSKHPTKGYRISLGYYATADGIRSPRVFWLGHEQGEAKFLSELVVACHKRDVLDQGIADWTPEAIKTCQGILLRRKAAHQNYVTMAVKTAMDAGLEMTAATTPAARAAIMPLDITTTPNDLTLEKAVAEFTAHLERKVPHQLSRSNCDRQISSLRCLYEVIPAKTLMANVSRLHLEELVSHFTARPKRSKTGNRMAVDTVVTTLRQIKAFLDWLDGDEWEAPRRMDKVFRIRRNTMVTPAEQKAEANGQDIFALPELQNLYAVANEQQRLYMLLGLNCAFTQMDIATLMQDDVDSDAGIIDRIRHKTRGAGVRGHWQLWPETATALKTRMAKTPMDKTSNPEGLAILSEDCKPLVHDDTDTDAIALTWARLRNALRPDECRPLSFKTLRKTASDYILRLSGNEAIQQLMLAHARRSIAARHYSGETDFTPLAEPLKTWHATLLAALVFSGEKAKDAK